jgi:hypothetical protein
MALDPERLAGIRELARDLNLPTTWLRAEAEAGRIPSLRAGRRRLFNVAAVRSVLLRRAAEPGTRNEAQR